MPCSAEVAGGLRRRMLAELIPDCRVKVFAGRGHSVYRDKLGEFSSLLTDFLG